ncbi:PepSY-like domain-containing protein [Ferruginibacter sp.]
MKKLILIAVCVAGIATMANAQKIAASKVPQAVKEAFAKQYPGITAKWEKEDGMIEAGFKQNGKTLSVLYNTDGTKMEVEMDIAVTELPATVLSYVKEHYKGKTIKEAAKITKTDGTVNYEAEVNSMDVIFDAAGKFLKEVKD